MAFLSNDDPSVLARQNAKRPNTSCSLGDNHVMTCDDCRDMVNINYQNKTWFCAKEFITARFKNIMSQRGRNIEVRWSNNFMTERLPDEKPDNDEGCENSGEPVRPETGCGDPVGEHCSIPVPSSRETLPTEDAVGEVYNG